MSASAHVAKLHEVLAVEPSNEAAATKLLAETLSTFLSKDNLFKGKVRTLKLFGKEPSNQVEYEALEAKDSINIPVTATVPANLNYLAVILGRYYDNVAQKERTNQEARADVIVDNKVIMAGLPATFLLGMETKLKALRPILEAIPTMAPGVRWIEAKEIGPHIFKVAEPSKDVKTAKTIEHKVLPQPNATHPSQFVAVDVNKNIGEYSEEVSTGMITSSDKAMIIDRFDTLLKAVKQARMRANETNLVPINVGDAIMSHLFGDWYDPAKMNPDAKV